jgi:hypothetical protein
MQYQSRPAPVTSYCHSTRLPPLCTSTTAFDKTIGGGRWWSKRLRRLPEVTSWRQVGECLMDREFFGHHSRTWRSLPIPVPSQAFTFQLLREAMDRDCLIVITRCWTHWVWNVPGLYTYERIIHLNSQRWAGCLRATCWLPISSASVRRSLNEFCVRLLSNDPVAIPPERRGRGVYWLRIFREERAAVVLVTQVPGNPGSSITTVRDASRGGSSATSCTLPPTPLVSLLSQEHVRLRAQDPIHRVDVCRARPCAHVARTSDRSETKRKAHRSALTLLPGA